MVVGIATDCLASNSPSPTASQLSALTRLFSSTVFKDLAKQGRSGQFARLVTQAGLSGNVGPQTTVGDAFDAAFSMLKVAGLRDEYIYRAALTHKVLLGRHSLRTASMLTEFRTGSSKADLVVLNGTATVYEIKSERDSLARLASQVANYKRVFASVNVITSERHVEGVLTSVPRSIGVLCLSRRYTITAIQDAIDEPHSISPTAAFESLRAQEAEAILSALGMAIPRVPNTRRHAALRECFESLDPMRLHAQMVLTLKKSRDLRPLSDLVEKLPLSLHAAALSISVRRRDHDRLVEAISTPLGAALSWA